MRYACKDLISFARMDTDMNGRTDQELLRRRQGEVALVAEAGDVRLVVPLKVLVCGHVRVVTLLQLLLGVLDGSVVRV